MKIRFSSRWLVVSVFFLVLAAGCSSDTSNDDLTTQDLLGDILDLSADSDLTKEDGIAHSETLEDGTQEDTVEPDPCLEVPNSCGVSGAVDTTIGSGEFGYRLGAVFVGAAVPFGLMKVGPDTSHDVEGRSQLFHCTGYFYPDNQIDGFSHTHPHGTGAVDYGDILFMPVPEMTAEATTWDTYRSPFDHANEVSKAGYYAAKLDRGNIFAEVTASPRGAVHRYTFAPGTEEGAVLIDASYTLPDCKCDEAQVVIDPENRTVHGYKVARGALSGRYGGYTIYFWAEFDKDFKALGTFEPGALHAGETDRTDALAGAYMLFDLADGETVEARVGISFVDSEGARKNMEGEVQGKTFDEVYLETRDAWETELSVAEVEFAEESNMTTFYTALYHSLLWPTVFQDVDRRYRGFDKEVHTVDWDGDYYTDFSLWDTYRTPHPLYTLLYPSRELDMVRSLVTMKEQGGYLPKWALAIGYTNCMVGTSADLVVADTYLKGLTDFDAESAFAGMLDTAYNSSSPESGYSGRRGIADYVELNYIPSDLHGGSVSRTMEFAYGDYCIAEMASAMGKTSVEEEFRIRGRNYQNLWHEGTQFFRGRKSDGEFEEKFTDTYWEEYYTEGNAWQYLWFAPHDVQNLATLMGGWDAFVERLEFFFTSTVDTWTLLLPVPNSYYYHGNEPDIHAAFQFSFAGRPDLTRKWVDWIVSESYSNGPEGLLGNDDAGTLSAWYVFAALGLYPITCTNQYTLHQPLVKSATLHLPSGPLAIVPAQEEGTLSAIEMDGEPLLHAWISHEELLDTETLTFFRSESQTTWERYEFE